MAELPRSLPELEARFPDEAACARWPLAKRWALGVYHGLREEHLQAYLDEFVFRFDRRRTPAAAFDRLLGLSLTLEPATYRMLVVRS